MTVQGFKGINIDCGAWGANFVWVGSNPHVPMFLFKGDMQPKITGCHFQVTSAHPSDYPIEVNSGVGSGMVATSQQFTMRDNFVESDGSARYLLVYNGPDSNNDFGTFENNRFYGWSDSAIWFRGAQSFQHLLIGNAINANGTGGLYAIRASSSIGGIITGASWSGGVATFTTRDPHGIPSGTPPVLVTGASPSAYNVDIATATMIDPTHFSVPMTSNPGTYVSGGTATVGSAAASFAVIGGSFSATKHDIIIDGYSPAPFLISYEDTESLGNMLFWRNGLTGVLIREKGRWNKTGASTDSDPNLIDVKGSAKVILRDFGQIASYGATAGNIGLKYVYQGGTNSPGGLVLEHSTLTNDNTTSSTLLTGDQVSSGHIQMTDFGWTNSANTAIGMYSATLPITATALANGSTSIDAISASSFKTANTSATAISVVYVGSPSTTCTIGQEITLYAGDANTSLDQGAAGSNLVFPGGNTVKLEQTGSYKLRCGPLNPNTWTVLGINSSLGVTAGSYGDATHIPTFTVGADGRLSVANTSGTQLATQGASTSSVAPTITCTSTSSAVPSGGGTPTITTTCSQSGHTHTQN